MKRVCDRLCVLGGGGTTHCSRGVHFNVKHDLIVDDVSTSAQESSPKYTGMSTCVTLIYL